MNKRRQMHLFIILGVSCALVPILLDELVTSGQLRSGQKVLCAGFGGGLTWAGALLQLG